MKPWRKQQWCIPRVGAGFVAAMEAILDLYAQPVDPRRPLVCLDEKVVYLLRTPRGSVPAGPGRDAQEDYEYQREGSCNLFVLLAPHAGWRHVLVRPQRTSQDYAQVLRWFVDEGYPAAEEIQLVQDNLNTHGPAALYQTFAPAEARRIARKVRFHYTPPHGSWLNMVEIEISVIERMCLRRRLASQAAVQQEVAALEAERNAAQATIRWHFRCPDARTTLRRVYPHLEADDGPHS